MNNTNFQDKHSLGKSLDTLRASVDRLYELDDDNFMRIEALYADAKDAALKIGHTIGTLEHKVRRTNAKQVLGFGVLGVGVYVIWKKLDSLSKRLNRMDERVYAMEINGAPLDKPTQEKATEE